MIIHIGLHEPGNAGDTVLFFMVGEVFRRFADCREIHLLDVHKVPEKNDVKLINRVKTLLIGGGGLFLKDTKANDFSGWQWPCSLETLCKIKTKIAVFAVGYNRFRGQEEFEPVFRKHLNALVKRSSFFGLRNHGSIRKVKEYLNEDNKRKVVFQPCPTTILSKVLPITPAKFFKRIAVNMAFDREEFRFQGQKFRACWCVSEFAKKLSENGWDIDLVTHCPGDIEIKKFFNKLEVPHKEIRLEYKPWHDVVKYYAGTPVTLGMRGHAQMVPFGCGNAIISLISHDKLSYFLDDIGHPEFGVEIGEEKLSDILLEKAGYIEDNYSVIQRQIEKEKEVFFKITCENVRKIYFPE